MAEGIVCVDFNGPVSDQIVKVRAIKAKTGVDVPAERFGTKLQVVDDFAEAGLTWEGYELSMAYAFGDTQRFRELAQLIPGAKDALLALSDAGYEIHVISSCRGFDAGWMRAFLAENGIPADDFISVKKDEKAGLYALCDFVIDDEAERFKGLFDHHSDVTPILMLPCLGGTGSSVLKPPGTLDPRIRVAHGWEDVLQHIPINQALAA